MGRARHRIAALQGSAGLAAGVLALGAVGLGACASDRGADAPPASAAPVTQKAKSEEKPAMGELRAFEVYDGEVHVGTLGEGRGPFVSLISSSLPNPWLEHVRFNSMSPQHEAIISRLLDAGADLDAVADRLRAGGFRLESVPYHSVFAAPEDSPRDTGDTEALEDRELE
jgi:hypothetical protein